MNAMPDRPLSRIVRADEVQAWQNGFAFLERARQEAAQIRATASDEVARAREEGLRQGRLEGEAQAAELLVRTRDHVSAYLDRAQPQLADLTMAILRELLGDMDDPTLIARATLRALASFRETDAVTLSVPPALLPEVEARLHELGRTDLRIVADRHLTGRQSMMTSAVSSIDISLDAQLDAIRAAMDRA